MFIFEGNEIETDSEGYLKDTTQWSEAMADVIAAQEGITLAVEHWEVVRFVREFYLEFNTSPRWPTSLAKRKATAAISIACSRKDPPNRRLKSPACRSR